MAAQTIQDDEFGQIRVKRVHTARYARLKVSSEGMLVATLPKRAPLRLIKKLIDESRLELRSIVSEIADKTKRVYTDGQLIGASHKLRFEQVDCASPSTKFVEQNIIVRLPQYMEHNNQDAQAAAKTGVAKALRKEAGAYLTRQLRYLADLYEFNYSTERFTHAKGRWGSCSSNGTISLNIALMMLPMDIIDYVLVHELCHTRQMNHSLHFWEEVAAILPDYKERRKRLKSFSPYL